MKSLRRSNCYHVFLCFLFFSLTFGIAFRKHIFAQENAPPSAESILKRAKNLMYGFDDQKTTLTFLIIENNGQESQSVLEMYWKNYGGQEGINSKTLMVNTAPIKEKGKKFLVWEYVDEDKADQWIYLPELRQVRRVQPHRHHHEGELESELVIEDVRQRRIEKDRHRLLPDRILNGEAHAVVETEIQGKHLYRKTLKYFSKTDGTLRKIDYFSETGAPIKTQSITWEQVEEKWVWKTSETVNTQTGRKTILKLSETKINVGLRDDQFSERALRR